VATKERSDVPNETGLDDGVAETLTVPRRNAALEAAHVGARIGCVGSTADCGNARAPQSVVVPLRTVPGLNVREHFAVRAKRVRKERHATAWVLRSVQRPAVPCSVILTRLAPSSGVDDDNLVGALKGVRDEVAAWLGVDDRRRDQVRYRYAQARGEWGVRIEFGPPVVGAQLAFDIGGAA
jgi:hypothetical protein